MRLHIGEPATVKATKKVLCGVAVKDKWWITADNQNATPEYMRKIHGANCKKCLKKFYKKEKR